MSRLTNKISSLDMKILMVDDDSFYVKKKIEILKSYGYEIEGETDARIALEKIKTGNYDLLLLDYIMDSIRGDEVVKAVREFNKELFLLC
jgi:CheY-like chemotaxis protein